MPEYGAAGRKRTRGGQPTTDSASAATGAAAATSSAASVAAAPAHKRVCQSRETTVEKAHGANDVRSRADHVYVEVEHDLWICRGYALLSSLLQQVAPRGSLLIGITHFRTPGTAVDDGRAVVDASYLSRQLCVWYDLVARVEREMRGDNAKKGSDTGGAANMSSFDVTFMIDSTAKSGTEYTSHVAAGSKKGVVPTRTHVKIHSATPLCLRVASLPELEGVVCLTNQECAVRQSQGPWQRAQEVDIKGDTQAMIDAMNCLRDSAALPHVAVVHSIDCASLLQKNDGAGVLTVDTGVVRASTMLKVEPGVVIGGTFDYLHGGHKVLLTVAAALATERLVVGLTVEEMLRKKAHAAAMQSFQLRHAAVQRFIWLQNADIRADIVPLRDQCGPSGDRADIQILVVSEETASGGHVVNAKRAENGLGPLLVFAVELAGAVTRGQCASVADQQSKLLSSTQNGHSQSARKLSSTTIRRSVIDYEERNKLWLHARWHSWALAVGAEDLAIAAWWTILCVRYGEAHRKYHTFNHVRHLLDLCDDYAQCFSPEQLLIMEGCAWFHDLIYDVAAPASIAVDESKGRLHVGTMTSAGDIQVVLSGLSGSNEEKSAGAFEYFAECTRCLKAENTGAKHVGPHPLAMGISTIIRATETHVLRVGTASDRNVEYCGGYFLDFDLAILASPPLEYLKYTEAIRFEYASIADADFVVGRKRVMCALLSKNSLYCVKEMCAKWQKRAVYNIARELESLGGSSTQRANTVVARL